MASPPLCYNKRMTQIPKRGLGSGLQTLIPQNFDDSLLLKQDERIQKIAIEQISADKGQPRYTFDDQSLIELADSIKIHGILQPLVVTLEANGKYRIVAGERRYRAAQLTGLKQLPVIVKKLAHTERSEVSIVENIQRVDLSPMELAISLFRLRTEFGLKNGQIAKQIGKAESTVNNIIRLIKLPKKAQKALEDNRITEGHARAILSLEQWPELQQELLEKIIKHDWNVRQAERFAAANKEGESKEKVAERTQNETPQTKMLGKKIGAVVQIKPLAKGGKLEIRYKDDQDLERIIGLF